ncbi:MAG: VCBS repeat-containing protein [Pirellulales bacterium]|nr:VCBS repeat-containing protein [Pirellulales bacterium]
MANESFKQNVMCSPTKKVRMVPRIFVTMLVSGLLCSPLFISQLTLAETTANRAENHQPLQKKASVLQTEDFGTLRGQWQAIDDPDRDGWETEAIASAALKKWKAVGEFIKQMNSSSRTGLNDIAASNFQGTKLFPDRLVTAYQDTIFEVQRNKAAKGAAVSMPFEGKEGLQRAIENLCQSLSGAKEIRIKFKIFRVQLKGGQATTRQYVEIVGLIEDGRIEQHATWKADWSIGPNEELLLRRLELLDFEQVRSKVGGGPLFADCTESVLSRNDCFAEQFQRGYGHWMLGVPYTRYQITEMMGHPGLAIADVNGDQLEDLYVCQEQGLPNRLFLQQKDGTALEVSEQWECDWLQATRSALLVDLDNDGDQDLVASILGGVVIASNEGHRFQVRSTIPTGDDMVALAAADFDNDGDVDIYATAYYANKVLSDRQSAGLPASDSAFVYHDANVGGSNHLLRNDISDKTWNFTDATESCGLQENNTRFSFAAAWEDYDNDGDQDLYVANDYGRDNLYQNDEGLFKDVAAEVGAEDAASGMSVSWSDYDHDGRMDLYISNMWSSAGNRIAFQPEFKKSAPTEVKRRLQRFARGNTLLKNESQSRFSDVSKKAGVEMGRWAWGSQFADVNNDGWDDILIANGFITKNADSGDL